MHINNSILVSLLCLGLVITVSQAANPIAVFHGIGDSCLFPGMNSFAKKLGDGVGTHSACVESGSFIFSWFFTMDYQCETACSSLKADPNFFGKTIDIVGLSQGNLIGRCIIQKCDFGGKVDKFISIGGPHMGVESIPLCTNGILCDPINYVIRKLVYTLPAQYLIGPSGYFKDAGSYQTYLSSCSFLPDLNNEKDTKNSAYKEKFASLEKLMLVKFDGDFTIYPKETAWFEYFDENLNLQSMNETKLYQEDYIGLKSLDQSGKVTKIALPGAHLRFTESDIENTFIPFLKSN